MGWPAITISDPRFILVKTPSRRQINITLERKSSRRAAIAEKWPYSRSFTERLKFF
jgi:hypothetical protein